MAHAFKAPSRLLQKQPTARRESRRRRNRRPLVRCSCEPGHVLVIGGGAAGLTAGFFAAETCKQVLVLEKMSEAGKKILISGGKRCNVLPMDIELDKDYFTESSKSATRAIFAQWTLDGCKTWLEEDLGLQLAFEEDSNKYFPASNSAVEVRDSLLAACMSRGVSIRYNSELTDLRRQDDGWTCQLGDGSTVQAQKVILATGGLSFPKMGTDGKGMQVLESLGHVLSRPYPALTPLQGPHVASRQLAGLSVYNAKVWCEARLGRKAKRKQLGIADRTAMLFTHRGFSGPAVLDLSHHFIKAKERGGDLPGLRINWLDVEAGVWEERLSSGGSKALSTTLKQSGLPSRLAEALLQELFPLSETCQASKKAADLTKAERASLLQKLVSYPLNCTGDEGYPKAEVTGGGVKLDNIDCATMESRVTPGLFLCGEVLDMFGRIGGFNFYWAWLTGRIAGLGATRA